MQGKQQLLSRYSGRRIRRGRKIVRRRSLPDNCQTRKDSTAETGNYFACRNNDYRSTMYSVTQHFEVTSFSLFSGNPHDFSSSGQQPLFSNKEMEACESARQICDANTMPLVDARKTSIMTRAEILWIAVFMKRYKVKE
jgi:hypothetical protein